MSNREDRSDPNHHPKDRCAGRLCGEYLDAHQVASGEIYCSDECSQLALASPPLLDDIDDYEEDE